MFDHDFYPDMLILYCSMRHASIETLWDLNETRNMISGKLNVAAASGVKVHFVATCTAKQLQVGRSSIGCSHFSKCEGFK